MRAFISWLASSGIVQGAIIGATFAFLTAIAILNITAKRGESIINGWKSQREAGQPGNSWLMRAALQKALPVVNVFEEAAYWTTDIDSNAKKLNGKKCFLIHFASGQLPPNDAFWSLTATDNAGYMQSGEAGRSSVDSHSGLVINDDGSVDIYLQPDKPSDINGNWLPTPKGPFKLMLRAYLPKASILDGTYTVPPVIEANQL